MTIGWVYGLYDPRDGVVRYVGQTRRRGGVAARLGQHLDSRRWPSRDTHLTRWLRLLEREGVTPLAVVINSYSTDELDDREIQWIAWFRNEGHDLVNTTDGGTGGATRTGMTNPETQREAMRKRRGWKHTDEARAKVAARAKERGYAPHLAAHNERAAIKAAARKEQRRLESLARAPEVAARRTASVRKAYEDPALRQKISNALKGRELTAEHSDKIRQRRLEDAKVLVTCVSCRRTYRGVAAIKRHFTTVHKDLGPGAVHG